MAKYAYGQQPSDLGDGDLGLGWLAGVRHLKSLSATGSFWHAHEQIQLLFCIRGEFSYEFRGHPPAVLTAGHFIVIPPRMEHRHLQAIDPAGHRIEMLIRVRPPRQNAFGLFSPALGARLIAGLSLRICTPVPCSHELADLFRELDGIAAQGRRRRTSEELALARTLSCLILQRCVRPARPPRDANGDTNEARMMDEAVGWLRAHAAERVRMSRLVSYMGYSRSRLFELFKRRTGLTPADWLVRHRIRQARKLLETTSSPVVRIAADCGFSSPQYFNDVFRRQTGSTPSAWRKAHLPKNERMDDSPQNTVSARINEKPRKCGVFIGGGKRS